MKKKMLAAAIASCLAIPAAQAAIDDAGMKYTSAGEGFYGSLRFALASGEDNDASVGHESSRIGVQGDVDVGHGNTAFYRAEWRVRYTDGPGSNGAPDNGSGPFQTRLTYVGMRGAFGSVQFGQMWSADYDYHTSITDVTNNVTGNLAPRFRVGNALRYDSPDIQGFNFSLQVHSDDNDGPSSTVAPSDSLSEDRIEGLLGVDPASGDPQGIAVYNALTPVQREDFRNTHGLEETGDPVDTGRTSPGGQRFDAATGNPVDAPAVPISEAAGLRYAAETTTDSDDGNEFDRYVIGASYSIRGLYVGASYFRGDAPDSSDAEDETTWGIGGSYGQDNWKVGYLYLDSTDYLGVDGDDLTGHSFAGQVSFDKITLRAVYDTQEFEDQSTGISADTDAFTLEAQYSFSSKARAYVNYQNVDAERGGAGLFGGAGGQDASDSDTFYVAYRVDF